MRACAIFLLATLLSSVSFAGDGYKCEPKQILSLGADGLLTADSTAKMLVQMNKEFFVDRTTGRMVGSKGFSNHNEGYGSPQVIDPGSVEQSFKVLTVYKPNVSVAYLEVKEFSAGNVKPFSFIGGGVVVSGTCEHL